MLEDRKNVRDVSWDEVPKPVPLGTMREVDDIATAIQRAAITEREAIACWLDQEAERYAGRAISGVLRDVADDIREGKHT
jgi:hypothetical protein